MEKELFLPIREYFEEYGYVCDGEVGDIDLYMEKGQECVAIELKESLNFKVIKQAALRQKMVDTVFIGIPTPKNMRSRDFNESVYLLKRLGIGLITVSKRTGRIEIVNEPVVSEISSYVRSNKEKKGALAKEFQRRKIKNNTGGVTRTKVMTGYREESLLVLSALIRLGGEAKAKDVKTLSGVEKACSIMYNNYYGWFSRCEKGVYSVREEGYAAKEEYRETIELLEGKMNS